MTTTRLKLQRSIFALFIRLTNRPVAGLKGKGMQLGKKTNTRLYDALSSEIASVEDTIPLATPSPTSTAQETSSHTATSNDNIQISFTETMSAKVNRDGGLEAMDVQGQLNLQISDSTMSRVQLGLHSNDADGTQFKTHPNVDRNLFKDHHKIGLRDPSRPFPLNQQMSVLRWRLQAKDDSSKLPISGMNCFCLKLTW
jgi:coatomer subunit delta